MLSNAAASRGHSPLPPHTQTHNPTPRASDFIAASTVNNSICFLGPHRVYSPWSATYQELVPGQGHFGPDALPGDARWRRGESVSRESARNAMTGIEAAAHSQLVFQKRM